MYLPHRRAARSSGCFARRGNRSRDAVPFQPVARHHGLTNCTRSPTTSARTQPSISTFQGMRGPLADKHIRTCPTDRLRIGARRLGAATASSPQGSQSRISDKQFPLTERGLVFVPLMQGCGLLSEYGLLCRDHSALLVSHATSEERVAVDLERACIDFADRAAERVDRRSNGDVFES
jgi:hypothetical protein